MSRGTGTFNFAANFEGLIKAPIDAKQLVGTYADLILPASWCASGAVWLYDGAIVSVASGVEKGIYFLCDANNYTMTCSWVKAGSGSGSGTLTGATNGLHLINSGTTVVLGGNLTSGTTINGLGLHSLNLTNLSGFQVSSSGGTSVSLNTTEGLIYGGNYSSSNPYWIPTKLYVDGIAIGLNVHTAAYVATTSGITLSGLTIVDGIVTTTGMRVLVKNQSPDVTGATTNGIYSASTGTWSRTADYNFSPSGEISNGDLIPVTSGLTQYNSLWALTTPNPVVSGTSGLAFTLFSMPTNFIAGTGIGININTISLDAMAQSVRLNAITGATNGLTESGRKVSLGGTLTGSTIISDSRVVTKGIEYGGNYSSGFSNCSLVTKEYVQAQISSGGTYNLSSPATCTIGGVTAGDILTGKTAFCLLQKILAPELFPTSLVAPSTSISMSPSTSQYEIGAVIATLNVSGTFNCGSISPQYCSASSCRSGLANCYVFTGCQVAGSYPCTSSSVTKPATAYVICASQTWTVCTCYDAGVQPKGSSGTNYSSALPAGATGNASCTITGIYPYYFGKLTSGSRPAVTNALVTTGCIAKCVLSSTGTVTVSFNSSASEYTWLAIPQTSTSKTCWYVNALDNGAVNQAPSNKYPDECQLLITSAEGCWASICYKVYMSGAVGAIAAPMEFRN